MREVDSMLREREETEESYVRLPLCRYDALLHMEMKCEIAVRLLRNMEREIYPGRKSVKEALTLLGEAVEWEEPEAALPEAPKAEKEDPDVVPLPYYH